VTASEGKTAFVVKITWTGVTCPTFASVYLTGCMDQVADTAGKLTATWAIGLDAIELSAISGYAGWYKGESNLYTTATYTANLGPGVTDQHLQYSLVVGYNSTAAVAASKKGLQWADNLKGTYCATFAYPANPTFAEPGADRVVHLHDDGFTAVPKTPVPALTNYTIKVAFSEALPAWEVPHLFGSFDGWLTTYSADNESAHRMVVSSADRKIWKYAFASIMPDTYDITMSLDYTITAVTGQTAYAWTKPDEWQAGNLKLTVNDIDGNDFVMADDDAFPATLTNTGVLADPTLPFAYTFIMVNTGTALVDAAQPIYVSGNMNSWAAAQMIVDASGLKYTVVLQAPAGSYQFGIHNDGWKSKVATNAAGDNFSVTLAAKAQTITVTADMTTFSLATGVSLIGTAVVTDTAA
jgi:hypothetical protein